MNCNICDETFNKTQRAKIVCLCEFECCRKCSKTYILSKNIAAHCMSCKVGWDRAFLAQNFDKTFITKDYKIHYQNILFEKEIGMLQATQPYVEKQIRTEELKKEEEELKKQFYKKLYEIHDSQRLLNEKPHEKKQFVRKCPFNTCQGFLSSSLKCGICGCFACGDCQEVKGFTTEEKDNHECNAEIVESVKMLAKDSKHCPKCASLTFKILGCHQMFCVECHTPWDWKTGNIVTGQIHNPHYFEWQRRTQGVIPRNPNEIICGREIDNNFVTHLINNTYREIARKIIHINHVDRHRFRQDDLIQKNLDLRIDFMRNKIDKEYMMKTLQVKEKKNEKNNEIWQILTMYINSMTDIFYRLVQDQSSDKWLKEFKALTLYTNECFKKVSVTYNCKNYVIDPTKFVLN